VCVAVTSCCCHFIHIQLVHCYVCLTVSLWMLLWLFLCLQAPITLPVEGKLVYSPHVYGPDVFGQPYFADPSFPDNMPDIWSRHFGCVCCMC
jgi:hypothetical protein